MTIEDAVAAQFGDRETALEKPIFERMRRTRHAAAYPDRAHPPITPADARWALEKADAALAFARSLVDAGSLGLFAPPGGAQ